MDQSVTRSRLPISGHNCPHYAPHKKDGVLLNWGADLWVGTGEDDSSPPGSANDEPGVGAPRTRGLQGSDSDTQVESDNVL